MSKILAELGEALLKMKFFKKAFGDQVAGHRVAPPRAGNNDARYQLRLDAGELVDGKRMMNLQIDYEAKNKALVKYRAKHGSHANLAQASIDPDTPEDKQMDVFNEFWEGIEEEG